MEDEGDQNRNQNGGESPTTYVRGYQQLPQKDIDMPSTSGWDNKTHTEPQARQDAPQPYPPPQPPYTTPAPPYTPPGPPYLPVSPYAPAPQTFQAQQQSSNNVVVVNQPSATSPMVIEDNVGTPPNDHLIFTICTFVVCMLLCNWFFLVCLIPALCLSLAANSANGTRNYPSAQRSANFALCCNIGVYGVWLGGIILTAVLLALLFTVGLGFLGTEANL